MERRRRWVMVMTLVPLAALLPAAGCASTPTVVVEHPAAMPDAQQRGLWVTGIGEMRMRPDLAVISFGVEVRAASVEQAQEQSVETLERVMETLEDIDVDEDMVRTTDYSIRELTRWNEDSGEEVVTGYEVSTRMEAEAGDGEEAGEVIAALVEAAGDRIRIYGVRFEPYSPDDFSEDVLIRAMEDAEWNAVFLAERAGVMLGKPIFISDGGPIAATGRAMELDYPAVIAGTTVPAPPIIEPGELTFTATVQACYEILANPPAPVPLIGVEIEPAAGSYLDRGNQEESPVKLIEVEASIGICQQPYGIMRSRDMLHIGDPCLLVRGRIENQHEEAEEITIRAVGYDENENIVSGTLDSDRIPGVLGMDVDPGEIGEFVLHMNPSDRLRTIRIYGSVYEEPDFVPSKPVAESEMTRITFSLEWLLENDAEPDDDTVTITFPESWLREPPEIPADEETVELSVPTRLLMDHNESDDPSVITVTFPDRYFDGL